jgi:hypothetical protein
MSVPDTSKVDERTGAADSAYLVLLIDHSRSMTERLAGHQVAKRYAAAAIVNQLILELPRVLEQVAGRRGWFELSVVSYTTDERGNSVVEPALRGPLTGRGVVAWDELRAGMSPNAWYEAPDEDRVGGSPLRAALAHVKEAVSRWCSAHPTALPPMVVHLTGGSSTDGDPEPAALDLQSLATSRGRVLLINVYLASADSASVLFPATEDAPGLSDALAVKLLRMSSELPAEIHARAAILGLLLPRRARGLISVNGPEMLQSVPGLVVAAITDLRSPRGAAVVATLVRDLLSADSASLWLREHVGPFDRSVGLRLVDPTLAQRRTGLDEVQFTVYRPKVVRPGEWYAMLSFVHLADRRPGAPATMPDPIEQVRQEAEQFLGERSKEFRETSADALQAIPQEAEITLVPDIPGIAFNPERRTFRWLEDVHREEFRLKASPELDGTTARGHLMAYLGAILLAEVDLAIRVDSTYRSTADADAPDVATSRPYRKIFASYSHQDVAIVRQYERFVTTLGDRYLRDVLDLHAGEAWDQGLLKLIDSADVFQLFWSTNAMASPNVRREWEYALALGRAHFIRPTYWEEPLPESRELGLPPEALRRLHFHRIATGAPAGEGLALEGKEVIVGSDPWCSSDSLLGNMVIEGGQGDDTPSGGAGNDLLSNVREWLDGGTGHGEIPALGDEPIPTTRSEPDLPRGCVVMLCLLGLSAALLYFLFFFAKGVAIVYNSLRR